MTSADRDVVPTTAERFFADLAEAGHIATFEREAATIRFDVFDAGQVDAGQADRAAHAEHADRWYVIVKDGRVSVTRQDRPADAIVRVSRPQFESIVTGRLNAQAALLRGLLTVEGKMAAVVMFQRCLPGPPGSTGKVPPISAKAVNAQRRDT